MIPLHWQKRQRLQNPWLRRSAVTATLPVLLVREPDHLVNGNAEDGVGSRSLRGQKLDSLDPTTMRAACITIRKRF